MINNIIPFIFLIGGIYMFINFLRILFFYSFTIKKWSQISGEIVSLSVDFYQSKVDLDTQGWKKRIFYKYNIKGKDFFNDEISKNIHFLMPYADMVDDSETFFIGKIVTITYNPKNPQDAVLESKFSFENIIFVIFGIILFTIAYYNIK